MKAVHKKHPLVYLTLALAVVSATAFPAPERKMIMRAIERESETHLKIRASALEVDSTGKFPISTLDKSSFQILVDQKAVSNPQIGLTTFDAARRWNNRAIVLAYDANGVKTMKGLNKELRTLAAQEFASFNSDFLSVLGVAPKKTFERVLIDPKHQDNTLALQRQLLADPAGVATESVFNESVLCTAAMKFEKWIAAGLKNSDQKMLILMGGAQTPSAIEQSANEGCVQRLKQMQVAVHQIIFARPETFVQRHWTENAAALEQGAVFRVVDAQGASRALQATRNILDKEYIITAQLPQSADNGTNKRDLALSLAAVYHGLKFVSPATLLQLSNTSSIGTTQKPQPESPKKAPPPPRFSSIDSKSSLALNAWIEWLLTSIAIGIIVTLRHMKRLETGIFSGDEIREQGGSKQGPLLIMLNGKDKGREFLIRQNSVVFGRGLKCDLKLKGQGIKRRHGCLSFQGDKAMLEDFSNGGLAVNGRRIQHLRIIGHGSVIQLGELQILFTCGDL
ncbi:FHA domain-containing protein [bacterium]|nr:FHA domain-containing protein [bacterium]